MRRRDFLEAGGALLAGLALPVAAGSGARIRMVQDPATGFVGFDPVGLFVEPDTLVTWVNGSGVHTVTAYHPANGNRPLRIPASAEPWDSGHLLEPGATFARRFPVPGVYDYFCIPHERAGMAGRIVVGAATGPGARDFDRSGADGEEPDRDPVPAAVRARLPRAARIVREGRVTAR